MDNIYIRAVDKKTELKLKRNNQLLIKLNDEEKNRLDAMTSGVSPKSGKRMTAARLFRLKIFGKEEGL